MFGALYEIPKWLWLGERMRSVTLKRQQQTDVILYTHKIITINIERSCLRERTISVTNSANWLFIKLGNIRPTYANFQMPIIFLLLHVLCIHCVIVKVDNTVAARIERCALIDFDEN